ncbi:MAG: tRNA lysidine(34) synthetase TilS [Clostridia bacterium]|nr:tRNA lysidine(34) synthetase TilS [Clostridia bacterium]
MICKVRRTVEKYKLLPEGSHVTVALSGGADSMALLYSLLMLRDELKLEISAAHVNHGLRGDDADRDEAFVREQCEKLGVRLEVLRADVGALAKESGESIEECGRRIRYDFFASLGQGRITATAHNLNDRAETFLFNFTRGTGLRGLCSTPVERGNIVRPLIDCSRAEIERFCEENSIEFVTDKTNFETVYARNKIRHGAVECLRQINPSFEESAQRCIDSLNEDEDLLSCLAAELLEKSRVTNGFDASVLDSAHIAVKKRAVAAAIFEKTSQRIDSKTLCDICDVLKTQGKRQISGGSYVRVRKGILDFPVFENGEEIEIPFTDEEFRFGDAIVQISIINKNDIDSLQNSDIEILEYRIDYDKINGSVVFRNRREGDRVSPAGRGCSKTLKKLFNEMSIEPEKRSGLLIVVDGSGILAVERVGVDERCAVTAETEKIMRIIIRRAY